MKPTNLIAASLGVLLVSCGAARHTAPADTGSLPHFVLILKESPDGGTSHDWQRAEGIDLSHYRHGSRTHSTPGGIVLVSGRQRDCDQELVDCHRKCMKRRVPAKYNQFEYDRGRGGREDYCNKQCMPSYMDCKELEKLRPQEFSAIDTAIDWLKRHRKTLLVGTTVVIAGVAFVVVSAGAGAVILAPVLLVAS